VDIFGTNIHKYKPTLILPFTISTVNQIAINTGSIWYNAALPSIQQYQGIFLKKYYRTNKPT
jgi:hypothetical protein